MKENKSCINGTETKITNDKGEVRYPYARILIRRRQDWKPDDEYARKVEELTRSSAEKQERKSREKQ